VRLPLEGILVADFSRVLAGPLATAMLADLGASVVKVERTGTGDDTRHWGPPWTPTTSAYFESANRSKRSIELDLNDPEDLQLAQELARRADVLVENFREGVLAKKGLGYEALSAANPRLVYCSVTGFGSQSGAALPGYDFLVQAVGGLMSITGEPHGEPTKVGVALVDVLTSKDAVIGILAALAARSASGRGQRVEVNLLSSLLGSLANQAASFLATGRAPDRMGNQHPSIAPYETLRCKDGVLALCCGNDGQFRQLARALGVEELTDDVRFQTNAVRVANRTELVARLEERLGADTVASWTRRLLSVGVPAGKVGDIGSAFELAQTLGLDPRVSVEGGIDQIRHPVTYSETPVEAYLSPPALGEHNDELREWLMR
jgi:crotonobetainyl-CoA:carnitine CoA-transferase CaiB-like acyl-CoA transferase